ncbi:MAG TPA: septum site-determining protein MinD [Candidatus Cybelea sp.]|jgi:septum site-determining protein MinD|nr:septum site-determining protein MinD [Candidatus Cybelea sp.]
MHQLQPDEPALSIEQPAEVEKRLGRAIVVTSGKGGVGKTTTTANLGTALAARGASVVVVDADVGLRNLDILLGLESRVKHHLLDVLDERVELDDALVADKHSERFFLLAAAQAREKDEVETAKMQALVTKLRERFDYVLIDSPAGIELGFRNAVAGADEAIVVCTPEVAAVRDVDRVVGLLGNRFRPQLVINRLRPALVRKGKMLSVDDVNAILRLPLLGVIADEPEIIVTTNRGEPLALRATTPTGAAYHAIAARLAGEDVAAPMPSAPKGSLFERIGSLLGGKRR